MTKRRDRNRTARRRKRVYIWHWTADEDPLYVRAAREAGEFKSRNQYGALKAILSAQKTGDIAHLGIAGMNLYGWAGETC